MERKRLSRVTRDYAEIDSTNEEMCRLMGTESLEEGTIVQADYQTAGKGHRGSAWTSERGRNLLFSILLKPVSLPVERAFDLSRITSLSLVEVLAKQSLEALVKWPNDILAGSRKICGILIENSITGTRIGHSIIGVGLNVNQERFDPGIPAPTSMFLEKGCQFDRKLLLEQIRLALEGWYGELTAGNYDRIMEAYHARLHRLGKSARYSDGSRIFTASILRVLPGGELELHLEGGGIRKFAFKEVEFID